MTQIKLILPKDIDKAVYNQKVDEDLKSKEEVIIKVLKVYYFGEDKNA